MAGSFLINQTVTPERLWNSDRVHTVIPDIGYAAFEWGSEKAHGGRFPVRRMVDVLDLRKIVLQ